MKRKLAPAFAVVGALIALAALQRTTSVGSGLASRGSFLVDANTVANVTFVGGAINDPYNTWSMQGTVGQDLEMRAAGPFSATDYYYIGTGVDPLDFVGTTNTVCVAFWWNGSSAQYFIDNGKPVGAGWGLYANGSQVRAMIYTGSGFRQMDLGAPLSGQINVACRGRDAQGYGRAKLNSRPMVSDTALGTSGGGTADVVKIGVSSAGSPGFESPATEARIIAIWASTTPPSEALFRSQIERFRGRP